MKKASPTVDPSGLHQEVMNLLAGASNAPPLSPSERRNRDRFPMACSMQLTPLGTDGEPVGTESITVFGRDLSTRGISFTHDVTLPTDRIILTISLPQLDRIKVEAKITWTRQSPIGLYESGGPLIRKVDWVQ